MEEAGSPLRRAWPHIRAVLVILHVVAIIALTLPGEGVLSPARWQSENLHSDFAGWTKAMRSVGVETTEQELADKVRAVAEGWVEAQRVIVAPFDHYPDVAGTRQGWAMFASPQRHPAEIHVDILVGKEWKPIFRPRSSEHRWMFAELDHHRLRKLQGRFAREFRREVYRDFTSYLAKRALADFPDARRVRIRLYRFDTLPPERVKAGEKPEGRYTEAREFPREAKR